MQQNIQERAGTALKTTAGMPLKWFHPQKLDHDSDSISDDKEKLLAKRKDHKLIVSFMGDDLVGVVGRNGRCKRHRQQ